MRLVVQSGKTGRFLVPSQYGDLTRWVRSLREAGGGVVSDEEAALQLLIDHTEPEDRAVLVDLDRLGTADDYSSEGDAVSPALRSGAGEAGDASRPFPDGNHGENN